MTYLLRCGQLQANDLLPHHLVHLLAALDALKLLAAGVAELAPRQRAAHGANNLRRQDLPIRRAAKRR
jgi:hypothetical protein